MCRTSLEGGVPVRKNEQDLFPGSNGQRQKTQDHPVRFGTGRLYHPSTGHDQRLSQSVVFATCLDLLLEGLAVFPAG